jgi:hypothetical protein
MFSKRRTFVVVLAVALLMLLAFTSMASADSAVDKKGPVCVDGYVINHRELPVDGTKTSPTLVVTAKSETASATAEVDEHGYFKFDALAEGDWEFSLPMPTGWVGIAPEAELQGVAVASAATFEESETCYKIVFKIKRLVTIPVLKWEEMLDGTVQPGDDWLITATPVKDPFAVVVTATVENGQTSITLTPGTWTVAETVKKGWTPLTPPSVTRVVDQYEVGGAINPIVFKNREPQCYGSITVTKTGFGTDSNGDEAALGTLAGWKVTVSRADNTMPPITKVTDGSGTAVFEGLWPGVYKVTETVQTGWEVVGDNPVVVVVALNPEADSCDEVEVSFQNKELIGDLKITGKKLFKAWEPPYKGTLVGLAGWGITATLVGTEDFDIPVQVSTTTNALGEYKFSMDVLKAAGMAFGGASIEVCEEDRDHWIHITPDCVVVKFPFPVPPEYEGVVVDFTNIQDPPVPSATTAYSYTGSTSGSCATVHTVSRGDTLAKISNKYGVPMKSLITTNHIRNADLIYLGQPLCIK